MIILLSNEAIDTYINSFHLLFYSLFNSGCVLDYKTEDNRSFLYILKYWSVPQCFNIDWNDSLYIWMRFSPSTLIYLSMQWIVLFLEQKESFIVLTTKISLSLLYILKRPVGWLFIYYPTQRNSTCLDTQNNILWRSFYTIHLCWHVLVTLPVRVTTPLCSQQDPSFSVRARI